MALLAARGISKRFPGVLALDAVDMAVEAGEVLAVIGENGAGKSTLMKILAGIETPDSGQILRDGESVIIDSPRRAAALGIALIHQELNFLRQPLGRRQPLPWPRAAAVGDDRPRRLREGAVQALAQLGIEVSPDTLMGDLPIGHQQLVEIAKALSTEARILIMDEPTSSLTSQEAEALFAVINELRWARCGYHLYLPSTRRGRSASGSRLGPLRRAKRRRVGSCGNQPQTLWWRRWSGATSPSTTRTKPIRPATSPSKPRTWSSLRGLNTGSTSRSDAGQLVGIAGLVGAGRTELLEVLFGIVPALGGSVLIDGAPHAIRSPADAIRAGLALVPEDRKHRA